VSVEGVPGPAGGQRRDLDRQAEASRFGTDAFYAAIGRAFVAMCAVVPVLFVLELIDRLTGQELDRLGGIRPHHVDGLDGIVFAPLLQALRLPGR
jgi:hypothetical protein